MTQFSFFLWAGQFHGAQALQLLLKFAADNPEHVCLAGVCVAETDPYREKIQRLTQKAGLQLYSPEEVVPYDFDLGFIVGFPPELLPNLSFLARHRVINLTLAPLPHYFGQTALSHAMINGDKRFGVTLHLVDEGFDTGDIIAQRWLLLNRAIPAFILQDRLAEVGLKLLGETLPDLILGNFTLTSQAQVLAQENFAPHFCTRANTKPLYQLELEWSFAKLYQHVCALTTGESEKPYFEHAGRRIYLSLE